MHKALRITVSLMLSVFILLGGSGMIIGKMVCLKSGRTQYDVKAMRDCCSKEEKPVSLQKQCCDISVVAFHQGNFIQEGASSLKAPHAVKIAFALPALLTLPARAGIVNRPAFVPSWPPSCGEAPQSFLCVYRI